MFSPIAQSWRSADPIHRRLAATVLGAGIVALAASALMPADWVTAVDTREMQGKNPRVEDFARTWSWIAAFSNGWLLTLSGLAGLLIVLKSGRLSWLSRETGSPAAPDTVSRRWLIGALAILVLAAAVRFPRMDLSLYYDEGYSLLRYIDGDFKGKREDPGDPLPAFERVSWTHTFFGNRHGNNNVFQSLLSRLGNDAWRIASGAADGRINEWAVRLPVLVFGLASIGMLGRLLVSIAPCWISWLGMLWAALHPWHLRYSTEARGYGIAFFFMLAATAALVRALERNRPRWWSIFAGCQLGYMYAFPGALSFALALSGTAVVWLILQKWRRDGDRNFAGSRFLALTLANAASAAVFWQLMAPCIPQLRQAVTIFWSMGGGPEPGWWTDLPFHLVYGRPWIETYSNRAASLAVASLPAFQRWLSMDAILGVAIVAGIGLWSTRRHLLTWLIAGSLLAAPIAFGISAITDSILQKWYVVYLVSPVIFLFALGCGWLVKQWRIPGAAIAAFVVLAVAGGSARPLTRYWKHGKEELKDVVVEVRGGVFPFEDEKQRPILAAVWSHSTRLYDPHLRIIRSEADLDGVVAEARKSGRQLAIAVGEMEKARENHPGLIARLEGAAFESGKTFHGLEDEKFAQQLFWFRGR